MHLTILGASSGTGRYLLDLALHAGHVVRAVVRTPAKLGAWRERVDVRAADARDPAALARALEGPTDAVVSIVGASGLLEARRTTDLYSATTRHLLAAMAAHGHTRIIAVSSGGVEPQPGDGWFYRHVLKPHFLQPMYADMCRMEDLLRRSPTDWTIVRPPYLTGGPATGLYRWQVDAPFPEDRSLARGNLAHFLLHCAQHAEAFRHRWVALTE